MVTAPAQQSDHNFIVIPVSDFTTLLQKVSKSVLEDFIKEHPELFPERKDKPVVYRSREYVRALFNTTYVTLRRYTNLGLLTPTYFGRKVMYRDDQLTLEAANVHRMLNNGKLSRISKKAA